MEILKRYNDSRIPIAEVALHELFLLEVFRNFLFLEEKGYTLFLSHTFFTIDSVIDVKYKSAKYRRNISVMVIVGTDSSERGTIVKLENGKSLEIPKEQWKIYIQIENLSVFSLKKRTIWLNQYVKENYPQLVMLQEKITSNNIITVLGQCAVFIKENMMSIIEGKEWFN